MSTYIKVIAGSLVTIVLCLQLNKQSRDFSFLLGLMACCMVLAVASEFMKPVFEFVDELDDLIGLDNDMLKIMLKTVGIGFLSETACLICTDAGNTALGRTLQLCASGVILWISIPLFKCLLDLIKSVLVTS